MKISPSSIHNVNARVLLSAFGIHTGGGLVLLKALVEGLGPSLKFGAFDSRSDFSTLLSSSDAQINYVRHSFFARALILNKLSAIASSSDILLCFNSLPPFRKTKGRVILFVQAPHFIGAHSGIKYSKLTSLRIKIERLWFRLGISKCDEIWVQTSVMSNAIQSQYPKAVIRIVALIDEELAENLVKLPLNTEKSKIDDSQFSFFYPADAVGHKNHENLLKAWEFLAKAGRTPRLFLTLTNLEWTAIKERLDLFNPISPSVVNLGRLSRPDVIKQLGVSSALIFPSRAETFGLPLLEARALNIPIVASELDFVRELCLPSQTFDPTSSRSIAMAVLRFIDGEIAPAVHYYSAKQFVKKLLS